MKDQLQNSWVNMLDRLASWLDAAIMNLPNLVLALLVFGISFWLAQYTSRWFRRPLKKFVKQPSVRSLLSKVMSLIVISLGLFLALGILNLDTVLKSLLAGAGVAGLAVGLALQGTLSNTFSGIYLSVKDVLNIGDYVITNGYDGVVEEINLRSTLIKELDNNIVVIPNKMVIENPFKNYGLTSRVRVTLKCGVGYESDLGFVKEKTIETIKKRFGESEEEKIQFHYLEFGDSSINFQIRFWVDATANLNLLEARSEAIELIKKTFNREGINIPFPIRTLKIDSASKSFINSKSKDYAEN